MYSLYRVIVENTFGYLKSKFIYLKKYSVKKIKYLIFFTDYIIILYNFLKFNKKIWDFTNNSQNYIDNFLLLNLDRSSYDHII